MTEKSEADSSLFILLILSVAQLFGLSLWFVPNSVIDQMSIDLFLTEQDLSQLSIVVTIGFVTGALFSSITSISDRYPAHLVFMVSSFLGALTTLSIVTTGNFTIILLLRFLTGFFIAGIYPVGMKITANHFKYNRGLAIGVLLSALTIGSGLPYIFLLFGSPSWQKVIIWVSILPIIGGSLVTTLVKAGPFSSVKPAFSLNAVKIIFAKNSVKYANLGYLGHMWELYAFWVWFPRMLKSSFETYSELNPSQIIEIFAIGSFMVFLGGGLGNIVGGYVADRMGRTHFNILMLIISGISSVVIGLFYQHPWVVLLIGIIWGMTVIPDSPQYSTIITEVSDQTLVGSALAIQTASGFLLTIISISLVPVVQNIVGWKYTFAFLTIGPIVGIFAMFKLRYEPDSYKIARGRK